MRGKILIFVILMLYLLPFNTNAYILTPIVDDNYINNDVVINLSGSPYHINDINWNGVFIINTSNITLDCNGSIFVGDGRFILNDGFDNVTIKNCNIYNYSEVFIFNSSSNSIIEKNSVVNADIGIHMLNSKNNILISNNITGSVFDSIWLQHSPSNKIINQSIGLSFIGIYADASPNVTVENCTLYNNSASDLNVFDSTNFQIKNTKYQTLIIVWSLNLFVKEDSIPISYANVTVYNKFSSPVFSGLTDSKGFIYIPLVEMNKSGENTTYYNPYNITITKYGYYENSTSLNITENVTIHLLLERIDSKPPRISYAINPRRLIRGENVSIFLNATDNFDINNTWIVIILPNSSIEILYAENENITVYKTSITGRYNITIFANDSYGNIANITDFFNVEKPLLFNASIKNYAGSNLTSTIEIYFSNSTKKLKTIRTDGNIRNIEMLSGNFDFLIKSFEDKLQILLKNVSVNKSQNKKIILDKLVKPVSGFIETYAVMSTFIFTNAIIRMYYNDSKLLNEEYIEVYKCEDWNFTNRSCEGKWNRVNIKNINKNSNYVEVEVSSLSGFAIKQGPYCGDGICSNDENVDTCFEDCKCREGENRTCGDTDLGECEFGVQWCINGVWGDCIGYKGPKDEVCNRKDDDCNGIIDDVGGGESIASTACQCYDNRSPVDEICDGIDNDCDGEIDESLTRQCGPTEGICKPGISTCVNGVWGECEGGIGPEPIEKCDNQLDDDCDGEIDEGCENLEETCNNGKMDENEEGVDCGGVCPNECFHFPWYILIIIGIILLLVTYLLKVRKEGEEEEWKMLERKYSNF